MLDALYSIVIYPLYQLVELCYYVSWKVVKNSGYAVIGVSIAITLLCLPLYVIAENWQKIERDTQKKLKPGIDRIKAVFKGDEQYMILSTYYRENHYHPMMALRSSISLLIQIPFFMAAYQFLSNLGELQGAHFFFINDLGAPDALFHIGTFAVNVLPIAMTLINIIAGAVYCKGFPLKEKLQIYIMALVFLVLLYNSPSGLVLYWTMNNVFSLIKNIFYKFKKPLKAFYFFLCALVAAAIWYLLFKHHGFMYRRLMLIFILSLVPLAPLLLKGINWLLDHVFQELVDDSKKRTTLFILTGVVLALLTGFVLPSYFVASSPMEFSFVDQYASPFFFLRHSLWQSIGFCIFWPCCIYFLFNKKTQAVMGVMGTVLCFCAVLNAFAFSGSYGTLTSLLTFTNAGELKPTNIEALLNFAILLIPVIAIVLLIKFRKTSWLATITTILLVAFSGIAVAHSVTIGKGYAEAKQIKFDKEQEIGTPDKVTPVFHLSKAGKNVFVIMLDRAISGYIPYIFKESPELNEEYDGFVYYPNTVSYADHTLIGAPPLYGGYDYTPEEMNKRSSVPLVEKNNESLELLPVLFNNNGYKSTVTDPSWANYSWIPDTRIFEKWPDIAIHPTIRVYTDIWLRQHPEAASQTARSSLLKRNFIWFSFLKEMPLFFRDSIYNDGFWWNTNQSLENLQDVVNNYAALDLLPQLTDNKEANEKGTFTWLVNEMTHEPHYLQYPDYTPRAEVTDYGSGPFAAEVHYHANAGAIKRISTWLTYLKQLGVYDNTRIIIVADHGAALDTKVCPDQDKANLPFRIEAHNPLLLEKDFNSHGSLKTDNTFMTNADVPSMAVDAVIDEPKNPFTGNEINETPKKKNIHVVDNHGWSPDAHNKNTFKLPDEQWYTVHDNIFDPSDWSKGKN